MLCVFDGNVEGVQDAIAVLAVFSSSYQLIS